MIHEKRPQDNIDLTPRDTSCLFNVLIEELDKNKKNNIFLVTRNQKTLKSWTALRGPTCINFRITEQSNRCNM